MKRVLGRFVYILLVSFGFRRFSASMFLRTLRKDALNKNVPFGKKLWAWGKGFSAVRVHTYGINEGNYLEHVPDFDYFKLHPINGRYSAWIDDKLTTKYILAPFSEYLPEYYFLLNDYNEVLRLMDCPDDISQDSDGVVSLLEKKGNLALKLLSGSLGEGFYHLATENGLYRVNGGEVGLHELKELLSSLQGYLVTEYVIAHEEIRRIYDVTPNTIRVQLLRDRNKPPKITGSFIRFGTKISGVQESPSAGGLIAKVDIVSGCVSDAYSLSDDSLHQVEFHPDTGESLDFILPSWDSIVTKILEISDYVPQLKYLGFDIIITDSGFKIIEINSLTSNTVLPFYYPFLEDEYSKNFFVQRFKREPKRFRRALRSLQG